MRVPAGRGTGIQYLVDGAGGTHGDQEERLDARGHDAVAEFEKEAAGGGDVGVYGAAAPGAAGDGGDDRAAGDAVEEAARHLIRPVAEADDVIPRIACFDDETVAHLEVALADGLQALDLPEVAV